MSSIGILDRAKSFLADAGPLRLIPAFVAAGIGITLLIQGLWFPVVEPPLEVASLIRAVKDQLAAAEAERIQRRKLPIFELKTFDMEINYVVRTSGGVRAEVVGVGTNLEGATERVQTLKLHWTVAPPQKASVAPTKFDENQFGETDGVIEVPARPRK